LENVNAIPKTAASINIRQNSFERYKEYPVNHSWPFNKNITIECTTYVGCTDTDRANLRIKMNGKILFVLSDLGWVTMFGYDLDSDNKNELIVLSRKLCKGMLDIYLIKFA